MNEAVFKIRASGDIVIKTMSVDYGSSVPSSYEGWCHTPYIVKDNNDTQDDLYEIRFKLSPFNIVEGGLLKRTCRVSLPIYVSPNLKVPTTTADFVIEQIACPEKLKCEELLGNIDVYINSDKEYLSADGGVLEIGRDNYEDYFIETFVSIIDKDGNNCSWATFTEDGNVEVSRRYFDDYSEGTREARAIYRYDYSSDEAIDNEGCSGEFEGIIRQLPRYCSESDVRLVKKYTSFPSTGETRKLTDIVVLDGEDSGAYEILSEDDIRFSGPAFDNCIGNRSGCRGVVQYSALCGYTITAVSNRDETEWSNLLEDKTGHLKITYHNKYVENCIFSGETDIVVNGLTCEELLERVYIAIKIEGSDEFVNGENIQISHKSTSFTAYILGDNSVGDYFDIDEESSIIPESVVIDGYNFIIPENSDPFLTKTFEFKFSARITDEEYSRYAAYGCSFEQRFTFTQSPYQDIENIGNREASDTVECDHIEEIPSLEIEIQSVCDEISDALSSYNTKITRKCEESMSPITVTNHENKQRCDFIDDLYNRDTDIDCQ